MAFTTSTIVESVMGNKRMKNIRITADAATQNVSTGLQDIDAMAATAVSMATCSGNSGPSWRIARNSGAAGTAIAGTLGISAATSGDVYEVVVWGT